MLAQSKSVLAVIDVKATPELETMLRIHNRDITMLRANVGGFSPEIRANNIVNRIDQILRASTGPPPVVSKVIPQGVAFYLGEHITLVLVHEDLDSETGETMDQISADIQRRLDVAVRESFEARNMRWLAESAIVAGAATAAFLVFLWIVHKTRVRFQHFVERRRRLIKESGLRPSGVPRPIRSIFRVAIFLAAVGLEVAVANFWLTFVLRRFPYTRPWGETLSSKLLFLLWHAGGAAARALPGLATVAIIMVACYGLTRLINKLFYAIKSGDITLQLIHPEVAAPTRRLVVAAIWIFGLVLAYPNLPGSQTEAFKGVSVFLGLLVTLGSSGVFGQALCGILLMYSRAFKAGDYIRIDQTEGVVDGIGALSTKIRTIKNEIVSIPNSVVVTTQAKNFSMLQRTTGLIVYTSVTIGYTSPWRQVEAMLLTAAERTPGVRKDPAPFVLQINLGDYAAHYELNAYIERAEERVPLLALLHRNIQDVFNEYGVQIMTPHYRRDPD
ncbi:MAG TPA: mechanosensitive ion channel domain-containing protein, partial [Terriglobales bacterium]|nr:mechanosensitive ion channel domain-containing protein [Terriglobales bacterium]